MQKYKIYTGKELSKHMYLETWKLDNKTFEKQDRLTKKEALQWYEYSNHSTIVLYDKTNKKLVGYLTPFLIKPQVTSDYLTNENTYRETLKKSAFCKPGKNVEADIYLFSTVVDPAYRDKILYTDEADTMFNGKTAFKILNEAFLDWVCEIKIKGVSIKYLLADKISKDGQKYLASMGMQPCVYLNDSCKYAEIFTPSAFSKCSNIDKLINLYDDKSMRTKFDTSVLDNHEYLSVRDNVLYYKDVNLLEVAEKFTTPLEVAYTPMITEQIQKLQGLFAKAIEKHNYKGSYNYCYATKANYFAEVTTTALNDIKMLETSSAYDIYLMIEMEKLGYIKKGFTVICNGYKNEKYVKHIETLLDKGINVIPVIENKREFDLLSKIKKHKFNVGLRYNSDFESRLSTSVFNTGEKFDNRFGFNPAEMYELAEKIDDAPNMTLTTFLYHLGGTITHIDNFIKAHTNIVELYCQMKKKHPSLIYLDFGGGFPTKYSLTYSFNYDELVNKIVSSTKSVCDSFEIEHPHLIGEHGRYTCADHAFYIHKVDFTKKAYNDLWYIINGSLLNMTPDIILTKQNFTFLPVNLYENDCVPVCLGGETCDPDDRYYLGDKNMRVFMPEIKEGQTLYIIILSVGAYQKTISGIGGLHHCLIPEGNEVIIYNKNDKINYHQIQKITNDNAAIELLDYNDKYMSKFYKK